MELTRAGVAPNTGAAAVAGAIRRGEITARSAVEACIQRIEEVDPLVNAVVQRRFDLARAEADRADAELAAGREPGPLHGVPITVKDQWRVRGLATTLGLAQRRDRIEDSDGPLVARLRRAGAIVLGKTNVSQLLLQNDADNPAFGRTNNPWDLNRSPGGSSGGEAAVIAYGGSSLGLGGDMGGSIRTPGAFCGVTGLKPTANRLSMLDKPGELFSAQEAIVPQPAPIAANVEDLVLAMRVLAAPGQEAFDPGLPPVPWVDPPSSRPLRVGWFEDNGFFSPSPAIRRAIREAAAGLSGAGHQVVEIRAPDGEAVTRLMVQLIGAGGLRTERRATRGEKLVPALRQNFLAASLPVPLKWVVGAGMRSAGQVRIARLVACPIPVTPHEYFQRLEDRRRLRAELMAAWDEAGIDVVLCPTYGLVATPHGTAVDFFDAGSYVYLANLLGLPAGTVPVTRVQSGEESDRVAGRDRVDRLACRAERGTAGLPVGVQVIGRAWREDLVLAAMAEIERAARSAGSSPRLPATPNDTDYESGGRSMGESSAGARGAAR